MEGLDSLEITFAMIILIVTVVLLLVAFVKRIINKGKEDFEDRDN